MTSRDEAFQPEAIDERLQQLKQAASQVDGVSTPNARLVQDLRLVYGDDAQSGQRVWERLATRLAEHNDPANNLKLLTNEHIPTERSTDMQTEQSESGPMPASQPNRPTRKFRRVFTLVAALLVALVLIGSVLVIIANTHPYSGIATAPTPTPTPKSTATAVSGIPFPASECPKQPGTPGRTWTTWYQLCQAGKFVRVNQSRHLVNAYSGYGYNETIEAAYADRNTLFLFYDFSPIKATDNVEEFNTPITKQGLQLQVLGGFEGFSAQKQHFTWIVGYDTSNLPANLQTLTLKINSSVRLQPITADGAIPPDKTDFAFFNVPLNGGQILTPKQTITANGVAITLTKAIIGASGVHLVFSASHIPDAALSNGFAGTLQAGKTNASNNSYGLVSKKGSQQPIPTSFELIFESNLTSEHGVWTLTVKATSEPQPWVFHFTVSA